MKFPRLVILGLVAVSAYAAEHTFQLTPADTKIEWELGDVLHTVHGTFQLKRGVIRFDPDTGAAGGEVAVDVASGESGSGARDKRMHLHVLESAKYPDATFTPDRIEGKLAMNGDSIVKIHGTFQIHGGSHEVTMNVRATATPGRMTADIAFDIPYVAWGMKDPSTFILKVEKTVKLSIHAAGALE
ncbi:MAG TPA: YceI family protein [Bryobacteraceae bacterium]|nr:YceI family protein [Bryobacteraceae bacterium]